MPSGPRSRVARLSATRRTAPAANATASASNHPPRRRLPKDRPPHACSGHANFAGDLRAEGPSPVRVRATPTTIYKSTPIVFANRDEVAVHRLPAGGRYGRVASRLATVLEACTCCPRCGSRRPARPIRSARRPATSVFSRGSWWATPGCAGHAGGRPARPHGPPGRCPAGRRGAGQAPTASSRALRS